MDSEGSHTPFYDRTCMVCDHRIIDSYEPVTPPLVPCPQCGESTVRAWLTHPPAAIGDECDITIKHGLCDAEGNPVRYRSKSEIAREAKRRGLVNIVEHQGTKSGDRNPHTTRWI